MATTKRPGERPATGPPMERLFVVWLVSALLLLILIVVTGVLLSGQLRAQARALTDQSATIEALRARLDELNRLIEQERGPQRQPTTSAPPAASRPASVPAREPPPSSRSSGPTSRPARPLTRAALDGALSIGADGLGKLAGAPAVARDLAAGISGGVLAPDGPETWARVAILANLVEDRALEQQAYARAFGSGTRSADLYRAHLVARLLNSDAPDAALEEARRWQQQSPTAVARVWVARAGLAAANPAAADESLAGLSYPLNLDPFDWVRCGHMLVDLERWADLDSLLQSQPAGLPAELSAQRDLLGAINLVQRKELVEAIARLDYLLELDPDSVDLRLWRGIALLQAGQLDAARATLNSLGSTTGRPEVCYWQGILDMRSGNAAKASDVLAKCAGTFRSYVPAHEARAVLALERGDMPAAVEHLTGALQVNPRRATSHFLLALAYAKSGQREDAASELQAALRLDGRLMASARESEAINSLFTPADLEQFAQGPASGPGVD